MKDSTKQKHKRAARQLRFMCHLKPHTPPEMYKAIGVLKQNWWAAWNGTNSGLSKEKIRLLELFLKQHEDLTK